MSQKIHLPKTIRAFTAPAHKRVWALPVLINFVFGGTATGFYILWTLSMRFGTARAPGADSGAVLAVILLTFGIAVLALESGRPLRARYLLSHWNRSWMSREAAAGMIFCIAAIIDILAPSRFAATVAACAAGLFLISQAMMMFRCTAVPLWRDPITPLLIISSGFASGYGVILFSRCGLILPHVAIPPHIDAIAVVCLVINGIGWGLFLRRKRDRSMRDVVGRLLRPSKMANVIGVGQVLPLIMILLARPWSPGALNGMRWGMTIVAAFAILTGNVGQKIWLIRQMQHLCSMQLGREK